MNLYELVTPSDPITFKAIDDKVAFLCAVLLGNGKAGCHRYVDGNEINIPSMVQFSPDPQKDIKDFLGCELDEYFDNHKFQIKECFLSFAYGDISDRQNYDDAILAITDPEKLKEFQKRHEDRNRTSMSKWVKFAWDLGNKIKI